MAEPLSLACGTLRVADDVAEVFAQNVVGGERCVAPDDPDAKQRLVREALAGSTVSGESKRDAIASLLSGADIPAARARAGEVLWLVDRAAAGEGPS